MALPWPKQLNSNPKTGYINSHKLKMNDGNNPQSQNKGEAKLLAWTEENSANVFGNPQPTAHTIPPGNGWATYTVPNKGEANSQHGQRETQPTDWKSTVAQNKFEHHNQQNARKTTVPKCARLTTWENDSNSLCVRETCTRSQNTEENI